MYTKYFILRILVTHIIYETYISLMKANMEQYLHDGKSICSHRIDIITKKSLPILLGSCYSLFSNKTQQLVQLFT
jgi:hypothetical protein